MPGALPRADDLGAYLEREVPEVGFDGWMILRVLATGLTDEAAAANRRPDASKVSQTS
jgi:hypothetical protein